MTIDTSSAAFRTAHKELVDTLLEIPTMQNAQIRDQLLAGLPSDALVRINSPARADLNSIVEGLGQLGRLGKGLGARPIVVVIEHALDFVPADGEIGQALQRLSARFEAMYGGDPQPVPQEPEITPEALIFGSLRDNRVSWDFIEGARLTSRAVCRLAVPRRKSGVADGVWELGTGWLIAPGVVITNFHVIDARDLRRESHAARADFEAQASAAVAWFDYHREDGGQTVCTGATLLADDQTLDYAIIELKESAKVADRAPLRLVEKPPPLTRGARLNIVQHSGGGPQRFAIRNNFYVKEGAQKHLLHYQTDTEPGASGSPVCDDRWGVLALHHASVPVPPQVVPQDVISGRRDIVYVLNEAIEIHSIFAKLPGGLQSKIRTASNWSAAT